MKPTAVTLGVFALVYPEMLLGRLPRLQLNRTGVALLGSIALVALRVLAIEDAARAGDLPTVALRFAPDGPLGAALRLGASTAESVARGGLDPPVCCSRSCSLLGA